MSYWEDTRKSERPLATERLPAYLLDAEAASVSWLALQPVQFSQLCFSSAAGLINSTGWMQLAFTARWSSASLAGWLLWFCCYQAVVICTDRSKLWFVFLVTERAHLSDGACVWHDPNLLISTVGPTSDSATSVGNDITGGRDINTLSFTQLIDEICFSFSTRSWMSITFPCIR